MNLNRLCSLVLLLGIVCPALAADEEECLFDQETRRLENLELQKQYPGSTYVEEKYHVVIPREGAELVVNRGGCVHLGVTVELRAPKTDRFKTEEAFFSKIVELVKEFGDGMIDVEKLRLVITEKRWHNSSDGNGMYYFLGYKELTAVEAYQRDEDDTTIVGVSFYR